MCEHELLLMPTENTKSKPESPEIDLETYLVEWSETCDRLMVWELSWSCSLQIPLYANTMTIKALLFYSSLYTLCWPRSVFIHSVYVQLVVVSLKEVLLRRRGVYVAFCFHCVCDWAEQFPMAHRWHVTLSWSSSSCKFCGIGQLTTWQDVKSN